MKSLALLALPLLVASPVAAQSLVPGPNQPGRYAMQPVPGGVARLDTVTGDVSLCRVEDETLRCRPSEDDDAAPTDRRSDLSGDDEDTDREAAAPRAEERTEADEDVDKAIRRMKKLFHAFGDIARDFEREQKPQSDDLGPGRT